VCGLLVSVAVIIGGVVLFQIKMADLPKVPTTKEKLAGIVSGFDEFDSEMKIGTRVSVFAAYCIRRGLDCYSEM
jgi:hypothetical protein